MPMSGSSSEPHGPAPLGCQRAWRRAVSVPALPKAKQFVVCDPHSLSFFQNITKLRTAPPQPPGRQKGFCSREAPAPVQLRVQGCRTGVSTPATCTIHHPHQGWHLDSSCLPTWIKGASVVIFSPSRSLGCVQEGTVGSGEGMGTLPCACPHPFHVSLPFLTSCRDLPMGGCAEALTQLKGKWPQRMGSLR